MQLYVNKDRRITERIVRHAEERGVKGLFITVDAPQLGRREKVSDDRSLTAQHFLCFVRCTGYANEV